MRFKKNKTKQNSNALYSFPKQTNPKSTHKHTHTHFRLQEYYKLLTVYHSTPLQLVFIAQKSVRIRHRRFDYACAAGAAAAAAVAAAGASYASGFHAESSAGCRQAPTGSMIWLTSVRSDPSAACLDQLTPIAKLDLILGGQVQ